MGYLGCRCRSVYISHCKDSKLKDARSNIGSFALKYDSPITSACM